MSDQNQPIEAEAEATPTGTPSTTEELYEKRFNDLRPQYDRTQNELHQARSELLKYNDPESRRQIFDQWAEEYGYQVGDQSEGEYEYQDPTASELAELRARQERLEQELQERDAKAAEQAAVAAATSYADRTLDTLKITNEKQRAWIRSRALDMPAIQHEGFVVPDIEAAYADYREFVSDMQSSWAESKKDAPFTPTGQENTGVPAWSDDPDARAADRQRSMMEKLRSLQE